MVFTTHAASCFEQLVVYAHMAAKQLTSTETTTAFHNMQHRNMWKQGGA